MSDKTKEQLERDLLELEHAERKEYADELKSQNKFNVDEREYIRSSWKQDKHNQEQECTRRAIETCMSVAKLSIKDSAGNIPSKVQTAQDAAWEKAAELIKKLG